MTTKARMAFALAAALLLAQLAAAQPSIAQPPPWRIERRGDAVLFRGRIDAGSAAVFLNLAADPAVRRVVLTSQGGEVGAALDMAAAIFDRGLDVEVPRGCYSSCANYLFPAGRRKTLGRPDAVGWHGNMAHVLYLAQTGQGHWSEQEMAVARNLAQREAAFYRRIGVDGYVCWFGKLPPYEVAQFYALSVADMERFGLTQVSVAPLPPDTPALEDVQMIAVDWATLEAGRPPASLP